VSSLRRFALVLLALAVLAAGCSGAGGQTVARVGDTEIHLAEIGDLFEGDTLPLDDVFLEALFRLMAVEALEQALLADFGKTVDPAAVETYFSQLEESRASQGVTPAQFLGMAGASVGMIHFNAEVLALRDVAIEEVLVLPSTVDYLFSDPVTLTEVCAKHILVATAEEAEEVKARLEAGEDFAAVADEVSLDTSSAGGDLGCANAGGYVGEFAQAAVEAALGEITGPVQTEFGFHLLIVSSRTSPTPEEYLADPRALLTDEDISGLWTGWLNGVLQETDAWVDERYGTWTPIGIKAPETGTTTTGATTTSSAG
jgi:parvulin-like peptidyl-prolyl isomerase